MAVPVMAAAQSSGHDKMGIVWIVEPVLEYDSIIVCKNCARNLFDFENDGISEIKSKIEMISFYCENSVHVSYAHGYSADIYFYDNAKKIFFIVPFNTDTDELLTFHKFTGFGTPEYEKLLNVVGKIDSSKIQPDEEIYTPQSFPDLNKKYIGKYAVMYDGKFVTGFIYDYAVKPRWYPPNRSAYIDVIYKGKWGVLNKNGAVVIPFIFDDIEFIDHANTFAFAKYNGKYGILDVEKTAAAIKLSAPSPATGDDAYKYVILFIFVLLILIKTIKNTYNFTIGRTIR